VSTPERRTGRYGNPGVRGVIQFKILGRLWGASNEVTEVCDYEGHGLRRLRGT